MSSERFEQHRSRLFGIAYRMLGSVSDAEDVVQEVFLRWYQMEDQEAVANLEAYLVTVATRLCLDYLKSAKVRRECYVGPWLPEPLFSEAAAGPEAHRELADTLSFAFMMLLERLNPMERAVYILREAFDFRHEEIAQILNRKPSHSRQLSRRAKKSLGQPGKRFEHSDADQERLFSRFVEASAGGDLKPLFDLLADDITLYSDGGGKVLAALRPLRGKERIIRFLNRALPQQDSDTSLELCQVNRQPALRICLDSSVIGIVTLHFVQGKLQQIFVVKNPDKLVNTEIRHSIR